MSGRRVAWAAALVIVLGTGATARAGTLQTIDGYTYNGVVEQVTETGVKFLWQKGKDQPEDIRKGKADFAFKAQGDEIEVRDIAYTSIAKIQGVPAERFPAMYQFNLFFRTLQELEAGRLRMGATGDFYKQVKSGAVLMVAILVLVPLLLLLVSTVLPGERLSYFSGVVFAIVFTLVGMGAALGSGLLTAAWPTMASPGAQIALTVGIVALLGLGTHLGTSHSFWQAIAFAAVWGVSLIAAGRLAARLAGVGGLGI
jgi:hypothetical protein